MREGTGKRFVGLDISLRCIYKPSLAGNGSYISVVRHGLHFGLLALADSVTVLTIVYRLTGHQSRTEAVSGSEAALDLQHSNFRTSFLDCPSRETLVGRD